MNLDFGYPWWLTYGHLTIAAAAAGLFAAARIRRWPRILTILIGIVAVWSLAAFLVSRLVFNFNGRMELPTAQFLPSGGGRVLDMGAGTGKSALMVLEARPGVTVVALDLFADSYEHHFGDRGDARIRSNLRLAGLEQRATIQTGDMRKLPFDAGSFDGVVSSYAIDHLNGAGIRTSLGEAYRVLRPGGQFLLMVVNKDTWVNFTFGPLLLHSGMRDGNWWRSRTSEAGFEIVEEGTRPATLYVLGRKAAGS